MGIEQNRHVEEIKYAVARIRAVIENTEDLEVLEYVLGAGGIPRLHLRAKIKARKIRGLRRVQDG